MPLWSWRKDRLRDSVRFLLRTIHEPYLVSARGSNAGENRNVGPKCWRKPAAPRRAASGFSWRIVARYATRWWVEEYHKALKSGTKVEESQLEHGYRLESLVAVLAMVAVRLLNAKWLARARADEAVDAAVFGPSALAILAAWPGPPKNGWTHRSVLVAVARLGGFLARRHDGLPGWETIWRGWQRLMWMCQGLEILCVCHFATPASLFTTTRR